MRCHSKVGSKCTCNYRIDFTLHIIQDVIPHSKYSFFLPIISEMLGPTYHPPISASERID